MIKMGMEQRNWISRILAAGGEVDVEVVEIPQAWIRVEDGPDIRVPIRMFESLMERKLFERVAEGPGFARYRMAFEDE